MLPPFSFPVFPFPSLPSSSLRKTPYVRKSISLSDDVRVGDVTTVLGGDGDGDGDGAGDRLSGAEEQALVESVNQLLADAQVRKTRRREKWPESNWLLFTC